MKKLLLALTIVAALGLASASPTVAWSQDSGPPEIATLKTAPAAVRGAERLPAAATDEDYSRREAEARDLESFTGGRHDEVVLVTCSCVVVVILILIII
jgi:hypothetical protein